MAEHQIVVRGSIERFDRHHPSIIRNTVIPSDPASPHDYHPQGWLASPQDGRHHRRDA
jgi:hypothetical protein